MLFKSFSYFLNVKTDIKWWVFTGPESKAKTSLATRMADKTGFTFVEEQARAILEKGKFSEVGETELLALAEYQWAAEILALARYGPPLILDTDLLTMKVWYEWTMRRSCPSYWEDRLRDRNGVCYLLCHPDIEWEFDPLRSNKYDREELLTVYKKAISDLGCNYVEIKGTGDHRWQAVLDAFGIS